MCIFFDGLDQNELQAAQKYLEQAAQVNLVRLNVSTFYIAETLRLAFLSTDTLGFFYFLATVPRGSYK